MGIKNYEEIISALKKQFKIEGEMTLRRCWYVLLGKGLVKEHPNPQNQAQKNSPYQRLSTILLKARIQGDLSWKVIVDRTRRIDKPLCWNNIGEAVGYILDNFRYDALGFQENHIEVWVEKDAVSKTIYQTTSKFFVPLIITKGFSSGTYLHNASERFNSIDKPITILYLSDFDAEGEYFPELIKEQLRTKYGCDKEINVEKIALNKLQVEELKLPYLKLHIHPLHRKKKYVADFIKKSGERKVELDAIDNISLANFIEERLRELLDVDLIIKSERKSKKDTDKWRKKHNLKEE